MFPTQLYGECFISHNKNPVINQSGFHGSCQQGFVAVAEIISKKLLFHHFHPLKTGCLEVQVCHPAQCLASLNSCFF